MLSYDIRGFRVEFPFEAYQTQLDMMDKVISTLNSSCNALLESPTGTGKTMSLLCSILAWRSQKYPSGRAPKVFYASRTHSQIHEVVEEYKKSGHRVLTNILASRKIYCINPDVSSIEDVDQGCRSLTCVTGGPRCTFYSNVDELTQRLETLGLDASCQTEDIKVLGNEIEGCPYFATQKLVKDAELIFCPYSYLFNQAGLQEHLKEAIIVFDEAHNIESYAREAGSFELEEHNLNDLRSQLSPMATRATYAYLIALIKGLQKFITENQGSLTIKDVGSDPYFSRWWTGDLAVNRLVECGIIQGPFQASLKSAREAIRTPTKHGEPALSAKTAFQLEGLLNTLEYFFKSEDKKEYYLCLQRHDSTRQYTLSLLCMRPSIVFKDLVDNSHSIIFTSGTLTPMTYFSSELGIPFDTKFEGGHVIENLGEQVWAGAILNGANNQSLDASYRNAQTPEFQDELGRTLEEICKVVPNGSLVFFPSYQLMETLCTRWKLTKQWDRFSEVFTEPRGTQAEFVSTLNQYFDAAFRDEGQATLFAVCRGKVAEGVNFPDYRARAVIIVGIPNPNTKDIKIKLKRYYNNSHRRDLNLCDGSEWYRIQSYRVVNQAVGRCIRHSRDFGAIIFLDKRYNTFLREGEEAVSKWLRPCIKRYDNFGTSLRDLTNFFRKHEEIFLDEVDKLELQHKNNLIVEAAFWEEAVKLCEEAEAREVEGVWDEDESSFE